MRLATKKIISALSQSGYKLTSRRRAVLNVIALSRDHLAPAAIYERVHQEHPGIGLVTIYFDSSAATRIVSRKHSPRFP